MSKVKCIDSLTDEELSRLYRMVDSVGAMAGVMEGSFEEFAPHVEETFHQFQEIQSWLDNGDGKEPTRFEDFMMFLEVQILRRFCGLSDGEHFYSE